MGTTSYILLYFLGEFITYIPYMHKLQMSLKKHQFWTNYWNTKEAGYNM